MVIVIRVDLKSHAFESLGSDTIFWSRGGLVGGSVPLGLDFEA